MTLPSAGYLVGFSFVVIDIEDDVGAGGSLNQQCGQPIDGLRFADEHILWVCSDARLGQSQSCAECHAHELPARVRATGAVDVHLGHMHEWDAGVVACCSCR
jgi:hypothetical protein